MSATVAVSAMSSELPDPSAPLQIVHATFVSPVTAGAIEVDVEVLGRGRSMSHGRAELRTRRGARPPHDDVSRARFAGDGYASLDMARWEKTRRLGPPTAGR